MNSDSVYIDLKQRKPTHTDYFLNRLKSELQFVGYETYEDQNGKQDSLIVMYGCDISEGECFEEYKYYWYFDKDYGSDGISGWWIFHCVASLAQCGAINQAFLLITSFQNMENLQL